MWCSYDLDRKIKGKLRTICNLLSIFVTIYPVWLRSTGGEIRKLCLADWWRKLYSYTALYMQTLPSLLCYPLEPSYDVNIHERPPTKSALLGQTGRTILYCRPINLYCNLISLEQNTYHFLCHVSFSHFSFTLRKSRTQRRLMGLSHKRGKYLAIFYWLAPGYCSSKVSMSFFTNKTLSFPRVTQKQLIAIIRACTCVYLPNFLTLWPAWRLYSNWSVFAYCMSVKKIYRQHFHYGRVHETCQTAKNCVDL
jgi:hypothetical protein